MSSTIEYRVYHNTPEYSEYLRARFSPKDVHPFSSISFEWKGHRWSYQWTDFDDRGDFDVIYRKVAIDSATTLESIPAEIIEAAHKLSTFFAEKGIKNWKLGNCQNRI